MSTQENAALSECGKVAHADAPVIASRRSSTVADPERLPKSNDFVRVEVVPIPQSESPGQAEKALEAGQAQTTAARERKARHQVAALAWCMLLAGWNDASTGPLLPRMQRVYGVNFIIVSLIFVFACVGFLTGVVINIPMTERLGFGKTIVLGAFLQVVAYAIEAAAPPFPVFVLAYAVNGVGMALQDAQCSGYVASLGENSETKMGIVHAVNFHNVGAGAFGAPLVATQFAQRERWSFHYLVSLGIAFANVVALVAVFQLKMQDDCLAQVGEPPGEKNTSDRGTFRQMLALKDVHLLAFFILVYVGVEVTIGGWIVTFMLQRRGGGPSSGYISSGFFGGLMVGRIALLWVNTLVGERRVLFFYAFLAIGLESVVWFVPSLVGGAVAVSFIGLFLGPMYPLAMNQAGRLLPPWLLTASIGWIAGFGQAGSALFPFVTGAIASEEGIKSMQPLLVGMMSLMLALWALVPSSPGQRSVN